MARGYDQPKAWSNSGAKGRGLHLMGLLMARFPTQSFQGFSEFGLQSLIPNEEEAEESISEDEADPEVFSTVHSSVPYPGEAETPAEAGPSPLLAEALPSNS